MISAFCFCHQVFRHGDRTPDQEELDLYPDAAVKSKDLFYPYGMKALTNVSVPCDLSYSHRDFITYSILYRHYKHCARLNAKYIRKTDLIAFSIRRVLSKKRDIASLLYQIIK